MKQLIKLTLFLTFIISIIVIGCSSSKKSQCGCPNKQGMVGY